MHNFHDGGSDHCGNGDGAAGEQCHSFVDMCNARDVRQTFCQGEQRQQNHCGNEDQLVFDNPFKQHEHHRPGHGHRHGQSHRHENDCGTADQTKQPPAAIEPPPSDSTPVTNPGDVTPPTDGTTPPTDSTSPPPPVIDNTSIAQLTQLSEQLLPVHQNGTYATSDWETLHATQAQKATTAAQNGSNLEFFGDSITEAMGYNPAAMEPFKQAFGDAKPTSLAIGGDGTAHLLYRLNHGEMQGQPKVAVLMIGTNDIGSLSPEQIADNTEKSIQSIQLRSPNTKVLVMGVLPRPEAGDPGNTQVDATNAALARLATTNGAVQFANLRDSFLDGNGKERPELYQADKLHLTPAGYQAWADGTRATIDHMLNSPATPVTGGSDTPTSTTDGPLTLDTAAIRGVNLSGAEWGKNNSADSQFWPTPEELDYYKSKGMNTFRLMLSWEQLQPTLNGPLDPSEMNRLTNFLHAADERGLKVLLTGGSFNRYTLNHGPNGQGADGETNGTLVGQPGVPVSAMQDFWTKMVKQIDGDPSASRAVGGWDLTNEPHDTNGAWAATATAVDQAIRATGDNHTIVVEGDQWARDFNGLEDLARADKNIAFEAHSYWDDGSGGYSNPNPPADANVGVNHIRPFVDWLKQNNARGFVGEWGVPTNSTAWAPEVKNFIQYLNQNDIGNMVWAGGPGWQPDYTLSVEPINGQDRAIMATIMEANQIAY